MDDWMNWMDRMIKDCWYTLSPRCMLLICDSKRRVALWVISTHPSPAPLPLLFLLPRLRSTQDWSNGSLWATRLALITLRLLADELVTGAAGAALLVTPALRQIAAFLADPACTSLVDGNDDDSDRIATLHAALDTAFVLVSSGAVVGVGECDGRLVWAACLIERQRREFVSGACRCVCGPLMIRLGLIPSRSRLGLPPVRVRSYSRAACRCADSKRGTRQRWAGRWDPAPLRLASGRTRGRAAVSPPGQPLRRPPPARHRHQHRSAVRMRVYARVCVTLCVCV